MDEKKKIPKCFRCVHLQNTWEKETDADTPIYECFMFRTKITVEHYAIDCNNFYTGNDE